MKTLDCFGDICPLPILKIKKQFEVTKEGDSFVVVVDHSCVIESIKSMYKDSKNLVEINEVMNGVWEITFKK